MQLSIRPLPFLNKGCKTVGFRKTNHHSNLYRSCLRVGKRLIFVKLTVIPATCIKIRRLEPGWFSQNQPSLQPWASRYEGWNGVDFHETNPQSIRCRSCMRVGKRLVFVNPTVIPTMCFKLRRLDRGLFPQNHPSFQPRVLRYEGWDGVGFRKSNCRSDRCRSWMRVGKWLVFAKPTINQPIPLLFMGWKTVGFRETNRYSYHVH